MTLIIEAIPAFNDNYIWLLTKPASQFAICVDPGDADAVQGVLEQRQLDLVAILITHHHWDHTNGIESLVDAYSAAVYGPQHEAIPQLTNPLVHGDSIHLDSLDSDFDIIATPGHTKGHICYYGEQSLFCGDTLFSAGCGRLFEGTAEQMWQSLTQLSQLPDHTQVYCGHEYTLANLRFAQTVEPHNAVITQRIQTIEQLRHQQCPSLPSTIGIEKATNPFLRCEQASVKEAASKRSGQELSTPTEVFAVIRQWKDDYR